MTEPATVRAYRPLDHRACRDLWAELIATHRDLYRDKTFGGADPGAGFEQYLTRLDVAGLWVAEHPEDGVVGLVGLVLGDDPQRVARVDPVVVTGRLRGTGIGRALLAHVAGEARRRGLAQLSITPESRNVAAVRCFHSAGYEVLGSVTLLLDLAPRGHDWQDGLQLHELGFSY